MLRLALAALVASTSVAVAAPPGETPPRLDLEEAPPPAVQRESEPAEIKNPGVAVLLSLGVTTAGFVTLAAAESEGTAWLGVAGIYFGPSTGRWYSGNAGLSGLGLRAVSALAMLYGFANVIASDCDYEYESCEDSEDLGAALMLGGAGLWIGSSIADIIFARNEAIEYNNRHQLTLGPTRFRTADGNATGLVLTGRF